MSCNCPELFGIPGSGVMRWKMLTPPLGVDQIDIQPDGSYVIYDANGDTHGASGIIVPVESLDEHRSYDALGTQDGNPPFDTVIGRIRCHGHPSGVWKWRAFGSWQVPGSTAGYLDPLGP